MAYDEETLSYYSTINEFPYEKADKSIKINAADIPIATIEKGYKIEEYEYKLNNQ